MAGVIEVEGKSGPVIHPQLGELKLDANRYGPVLGGKGTAS